MNYLYMDEKGSLVLSQEPVSGRILLYKTPIREDALKHLARIRAELEHKPNNSRRYS